MRLYEGMFIISDTDAGAEWDGVVKHVEDILKNRGAEVLKSEKWEERKFAYKLKGHKRGAYLLIYFNAPTDSISHMKRDFDLSEKVLRALIVKVDKIRETAPVEDAETPVEETIAEKEETVAISEDTGSAPITIEQ